jgi:hypothetical protein
MVPNQLLGKQYSLSKHRIGLTALAAYNRVSLQGIRDGSRATEQGDCFPCARPTVILPFGYFPLGL